MPSAKLLRVKSRGAAKLPMDVYFDSLYPSALIGSFVDYFGATMFQPTDATMFTKQILGEIAQLMDEI